MQRKYTVSSLFVLALLIASQEPAYAQAIRTWVSGVGDDANPCSRTAPCKTFAGAISKTAAGGEINVLDPAGFGAVTITKSISIENDGALAGISAAGTNGVTINAGVNDVVVLRGLTIEGAGSGLNGVRFLAGGALHVENCTINNFVGKGISFEPTGASQLFVKDTIIRNNKDQTNGAGISVKPVSPGSAKATIDHVRLEQNLIGLRIEEGALVTVSNSVASGNTNAGFAAFSNTGTSVLNIGSSVSTHNGTGVNSFGTNTTVRLTDVLLTQNNFGIRVTNGVVVSFGNNQNSGNGTNGAPTTTIAQQ